MIIPVFLPHLGCDARCIYCNQDLITDAEPLTIEAAINRSLGGREGPFEIGLYGGNLLGIPLPALQHLLSRFDPYMNRISNFRASTKPHGADQATISLLKKYRVTTLELGIPIFDDQILGDLNRRHTVQDLLTAFHLLRDEGFIVALQVMVGLPGETRQHIGDTSLRISTLRPDYLRIYPLAVIEDTPLHALFQSGRFVPVSLDEAVRRATHIYLSAMSHSIKVVKMGLTDNEVIRERIVAGSYHPAFGYLVRSMAFFLAVMKHLTASSIRGPAIVKLNMRDIPHLVGHKRSHIEAFKKKGFVVTWETDDLEPGSFQILQGTTGVEGTVHDALSVIFTASSTPPQ